MKKRFVFMILISVVLYLLLYYFTANTTESYSRTLGVNLSLGTTIQETDTHGGFHGDGMEYRKISFSDNKDKILEQIRNNGAWRELPLTSNLNKLLYTKNEETGVIEPDIVYDIDNVLIPYIEKGYYFFQDKNNETQNESDDSMLFKRASYNFIIALYDIETQMLYYYELDT